MDCGVRSRPRRFVDAPESKALRRQRSGARARRKVRLLRRGRRLSSRAPARRARSGSRLEGRADAMRGRAAPVGQWRAREHRRARCAAKAGASASCSASPACPRVTGGQALRTNVTILFEGEQRVFATLGDDKCTVDSLTQHRVETLGARPRYLSRGSARLLPRAGHQPVARRAGARSPVSILQAAWNSATMTAMTSNPKSLN